MHKIRIPLFLLAVAALVPLAVIATGDLDEAKGIRGDLDRRTTERDSVIEELQKTNLLYRGHQKSLVNIPDSVKMAQSGQIIERTREFTKKIRILETKSNEMGRVIRKREEELGGVYADLRKWAIVFGGGALVFFATGLTFGRKR